MFCPNCKAEYQDGILDCVDCTVALVDELTPALMVHEGNPVIIFTTANIHEAHMIQSLLRANNIDSLIQDQNIPNLNPFLSNSVGGIKVFVYPGQKKFALEVLQSYLDKNEQEVGTGMLSPFNNVSAAPIQDLNTDSASAESFICQVCQSVNESDANFCDQCGNPMREIPNL